MPNHPSPAAATVKSYCSLRCYHRRLWVTWGPRTILARSISTPVFFPDFVAGGVGPDLLNLQAGFFSPPPPSLTKALCGQGLVSVHDSGSAFFYRLVIIVIGRGGSAEKWETWAAGNVYGLYPIVVLLLQLHLLSAGTFRDNHPLDPQAGACWFFCRCRVRLARFLVLTLRKSPSSASNQDRSQSKKKKTRSLDSARAPTSSIQDRKAARKKAKEKEKK